MNALARVQDALTSSGSRSTNGGRSWQCPAHNDGNPSLSVSASNRGSGVVLHCHAGCPTDDIVAAIGLTLADLFDEPRENRTDRPVKVAEYPYSDENGELLYTVVRYSPKTFRQRAADGTPSIKGIRRVPYRLPQVRAEAAAGGQVLIVEGEKDVDNLAAAAGVVATCNSGGAGKWTDDHTRHLRGAGKVVVVADRDEPGRAHAAQVADSLQRAGIPYRVVESGAGKDVSDHLAAGLGFADLVPVDLTGVGEPDKTDTTQIPSQRSDDDQGSVSFVRQWEDPVSVDRPPLPPFPIDLLGENLQPAVTALAKATQVSPDLAVSMALSAITTAMGGRVYAAPRPGWREPVVLWSAGIALPGERKTGIEEWFTAPLREEEARLRMLAEPIIEETKQRRRIAEERLKEAERAAVKAKPDNATLAAEDATLALRALQDIGEPAAPPTLFFGDITPAAMPVKAAENGGRGAVLDSEGVFFANVTGRRFGNSSPDTTFALQAYDGKAVPVHRVQRGSTELTTAYLNIGVLVQPIVLEGLARSDDDEILHNGFVQRFLYFYPESNLGRRDPRAAQPVSDSVAADYACRIKNLVSRVWEAETPRAIRFTPEANELMYQFEEHLEPRMAPLGDLRPIASWASKLPGKLARIAAALTLYDKTDATEVSGVYMKAAIDMAPYFIRHARLCLDLMGANREARLTPARDVLEWLRGRKDPTEPFTPRDVQRGVQRKWALDGGAEAVRAAIEHLVDLGWVAQQEPDPTRDGKPGRKPSPKFDVHPWVHTPPASGQEPQ